jgi:hypothetical protein
MRTTHPSSEDGDFVIRHDKRDGKDVYVVRIAPGADQYLLHSRGEAVAKGVAYAKRHRVRVWSIDGGPVFTLIDDFRAVR